MLGVSPRISSTYPRNRDDVRDHPGPVHVIHKGVGRRRCIYPMLLQLHPIAGRDLHNCTADGLQQIRVEQCLRVNAKRFNVRDLVSLTLRSRSFHAPEIVRKQNTRFTSATQFAQYRKSIEEAKAVPAWRESASQEWRRDLALYIFEESCSWQTRQISSNREAQLGKSVTEQTYVFYEFLWCARARKRKSLSKRLNRLLWEYNMHSIWLETNIILIFYSCKII